MHCVVEKDEYSALVLNTVTGVVKRYSSYDLFNSDIDVLFDISCKNLRNKEEELYYRLIKDLSNFIVDLFYNKCSIFKEEVLMQTEELKKITDIDSAISIKRKDSRFTTVLNGEVNVDDEYDLSKHYGIMNIPTLIVFKNGKMINKSQHDRNNAQNETGSCFGTVFFQMSTSFLLIAVYHFFILQTMPSKMFYIFYLILLLLLELVNVN